MYKGIYIPREDSYLLQKYVEKFCNKDSFVLDMGTGSGIQAITAARKARKVIASDISQEAIEYARHAAEIEKIKNIEFIQSDLFENIPRKKFDLIIFNPPYLPEEKNIEDIALFSGKRGIETTIRFISMAADFLNTEGIILITGSSLADRKKIEGEITARLLVHKELERIHIFFEEIFVLCLKKSPLLKELHAKGVSQAVLFAKGKRGLIIKAKYKKKTLAIKAKRAESKAMNAIENEIRFLKVLNRKGIGPKLVFQGEEYIAYWFVEGILIEEFIAKSSREEIIKALEEVLKQLNLMDKLGINKFEMSHPQKHIIVSKGKPVLLDFERARLTETPKNITQFCDYLSGDKMIYLLAAKGLHIKKESLIKAAYDYRHSSTEESFKRILKIVCS